MGWELQQIISPLGDITAVDYPDLDLTQPDSIKSWVDISQPDLILNAAAYTAVDRAEAEPALAEAVNARAPGLIAELARVRGAVLVHFSTDYVFDGTKGSPYLEDDQTGPINTYGKTKLAGEEAVQQVGGEYYIFRTSWLYSTRRDCFVTKVLHWARTNQVVRVVTDQVGSPTWAHTLAEATAGAVRLMLEGGKEWRESTSGIYHTAGIGAASRYEWAERIIALDPQPEEQIITELKEAASADFDTAAERPQNTALDCSHFQQTFGLYYTTWEEALKQALSVQSHTAARPASRGRADYRKKVQDE